jgi:hypothetical protein
MRRWLVVGIGILLTTQVAAQEKMVPEELVYALLGSRGGSMSQTITVGQLPTGFPADLRFPANARVLGGLEVGRGPIAAIVALPGDVAAARPVMERALVDAGWTIRRPEPMRSQGGFEQAGGFQMARDAGGTGGMTMFCKSTEQIIVTMLGRTTEETYARLDYSPPSPRTTSSCDERARRSTMDDVPMPTLTLPEGARQGAAGGGGGTDRREAYSQFETPATPKELLDHFSSQLRTAGWNAGGRSDVQGFSTATFRLQKDGRDWHAILMAVDFPGTLWRDVSLRVTAARQ